MKMLKLERPEEMLLALLRAALYRHGVEITYFQHATANDWKQCYLLAAKQGVVALAWGGVLQLPAEYLPPLELKLSWGLTEQKQCRKFRKHCQAVHELTQRCTQHGIAVVVLKGIGLSRLYPVSAYRKLGDIDIYSYSVDKSRMTDEEANRMVDQLMMENGIEVSRSSQGKDSHFLYHRIPVENHRMFFDTRRFPVAKEVEKWLEMHLCSEPIDSLEGMGDIYVPSIDFDTVYLSYHAAIHAGMGLSLHHLCDWCVLLQQRGTLPAEMMKKPFFFPAIVLTQLCNQYLGTTVPVEGGEEMIADMMQEIIRSPYQVKIPYQNPVLSGFYKARRTLHSLAWMRRLLKPTWGEMVLPLLHILIKQPGRLIK